MLIIIYIIIFINIYFWIQSSFLMYIDRHFRTLF